MKAKSEIKECPVNGKDCLKKFIQTRQHQIACVKCQDISNLAKFKPTKKYIYRHLKDIL